MSLSSRAVRFTAVALIVPVLVLALVLLGVLPVRAYATQRREIAAASDRLAMLTERNRELRERVRLLGTDDEIRRMAREQYAMVSPGEKLLVIPGLGERGRSLSGNSIASVDRVPTATVDRTDGSLWQVLRDLARLVSPT